MISKYLAIGLVALTLVAGFWNVPMLLGVAGLVMLIGNAYALVTK